MAAAGSVVDKTVVETIFSMMQQCDARLRVLEAAVASCSSFHLVPGHPDPQSPTSPTTPQTIPPPNTTTAPQTNTTPANEDSGSLVVCGLTTSWYTTAEYPSFTVTLLDPAGCLVTNHSPGWHLHVSIVNGHDRVDDTALDADCRSFPVHDGVATVSGLKFTKITSSNGGWFRLLFTLRPDRRTASPAILAHESASKIVVRCYRMKCEAKVNEADLKPDSDLRSVKGLGKAYVARWNELGFHAIADLAKVDRHNRAVRQHLLAKLRRNRGSLTEPKLMSMLELAHRVVQSANGVPDVPDMCRAEAELAKLATDTEATACQAELVSMANTSNACADMINWDALERAGSILY